MLHLRNNCNVFNTGFLLYEILIYHSSANLKTLIIEDVSRSLMTNVMRLSRFIILDLRNCGIDGWNWEEIVALMPPLTHFAIDCPI